ncbi:hypothetical protein PR048_006800 [Dryococelus australis]|uniref:Uncharacterized protein n=1 Tax=Dryococelus australis TaxID=614101 RepID=A0ABQ9IDA1_9NEOP|nr:hypothetical protein PR048_006800 [Dryococelus australis]
MESSVMPVLFGCENADAIASRSCQVSIHDTSLIPKVRRNRKLTLNSNATDLEAMFSLSPCVVQHCRRNIVSSCTNVTAQIKYIMKWCLVHLLCVVADCTMHTCNGHVTGSSSVGVWQCTGRHTKCAISVSTVDGISTSCRAPGSQHNNIPKNSLFLGLSYILQFWEDEQAQLSHMGNGTPPPQCSKRTNVILLKRNVVRSWMKVTAHIMNWWYLVHLLCVVEVCTVHVCSGSVSRSASESTVYIIRTCFLQNPRNLQQKYLQKQFWQKLRKTKPSSMCSVSRTKLHSTLLGT